MGSVLAAGVVLIVTHLGLSLSGLRDRLVSKIGVGPYQGLYSLVAVAAFANLIWTYNSVPSYDYFWFNNPVLYWLPKLLMPLATILLVGGFMVKNPTAVGQGAVLASADGLHNATTGVNRITRHPFQWAVIIWAATHLVANGDQVSVAFFLSFTLLSLLGSLSMDAKKRRELGEPYVEFTKITSNIPFLAILQGRNRLVVSELLLPTVIGLGVYVAMYVGHRWLAGVPVI